MTEIVAIIVFGLVFGLAAVGLGYLIMWLTPSPERHDPEVERAIMDGIVEGVTEDIDRTMLTPCMVCGEIGFAHLEDAPQGCTGFVPIEDEPMSEADAAVLESHAQEAMAVAEENAPARNPECEWCEWHRNFDHRRQAWGHLVGIEFVKCEAAGA